MRNMKRINPAAISKINFIQPPCHLSFQLLYIPLLDPVCDESVLPPGTYDRQQTPKYCPSYAPLWQPIPQFAPTFHHSVERIAQVSSQISFLALSYSLSSLYTRVSLNTRLNPKIWLVLTLNDSTRARA